MYYQFPKKLLTEECYSKLSLHSILLYCILKDRVGLSEQTGRLDENGTPYIFFSRKEMARLLRTSERSAIRYTKELESIGLISFGSKDGCTSPPIYVKDITQKKKPASLTWQAKSYDDDEISEALLRHYIKN